MTDTTKFDDLVYAAVDALPTWMPPGSVAPEFADAVRELLERVGDEIGAGDPREESWPQREGPDRWFMSDGPSMPDAQSRPDWTAAVALSRLVLGLPDPNRRAPE